MNLETILSTVLASSASAAVVVFLSKSILKLWLDKDLETHRANLATASARQIEQLRSDLERVAIEHEVRFKRLHAKRTFVIATIYEHLERLHAAVRQWNSSKALYPKGDPAAKNAMAGTFAAQAQDASTKLQEYYYPRAIWLERDLCNELNSIISTLSLLGSLAEADSHGIALEMDGKDNTDNVAAELLKQVAATRNELEKRFRAILGIEGKSEVV